MIHSFPRHASAPERIITDEEIARHEAGHAVAIMASGLWTRGFRTVLCADGSKDTGGRGFVDPVPLTEEDVPEVGVLGPEDEELVRVCLARSAISDLAGVAAQMADTWAWTGEHDTWGWYDLQNLDRRLELSGFWQPTPWYTAFHAAIETVDARWGEIEAIKAALVARRELSYAEVRAITAAAPRQRNPHREPAGLDEDVELDRVVAESLACWRTRPWEECAARINLQSLERAAALWGKS